MCYKGGGVGHNQVHDIDGNMARQIWRLTQRIMSLISMGMKFHC